MRLRFSAWALAQLEEALAYLAADDRAASDRVAAAIEARLRLRKRSPRSGRVVPELGLPDRREVIVPPLRVVYRIVDDELQVVAVVHAARALMKALPPGERPRRGPSRESRA